jgi:thiamine-phosphate pyrophosphorylase
MKKSISKLHFITTNASDAEQACKGGADWIQLRVKNKTDEDWKTIAKETKTVCRKYNATLIINDNVQLAQEIGADGVHLGKEDMSPDKARIILGPESIIGGTTNTWDDVKNLAKLSIDYIGLGPYHYTQTKTKLSPILGLEGYQRLIKYCILEKITLPIVAVGGIKLNDTNIILKTGVWGVAVSSAISASDNIELATKEFIEQIKQQQEHAKEHAGNWR